MKMATHQSGDAFETLLLRAIQKPQAGYSSEALLFLFKTGMEMVDVFLHERLFQMSLSLPFLRPFPLTSLAVVR